MIQRSEIRYADDEFAAASFNAWLNVLDSRQAAQGLAPAPRPAGEAPDAPPVYARMNYGRWLGDCECNSAVMLFRDPPSCMWFWCPACGNRTTAGKLRPVIWPENRDEIDLNMATLPAGLAHWEPGQDEDA